jgi:hydrogenase nickel incorporation protein HypB
MCGICGCSNPTGKFSPLASKVDLLTKHQHHNAPEQHSPSEKARLIQVEDDLFGKNNAYAAENRAYFKENGIFVLNLVSSPGAGKTTLLVETIKALKDKFPIAVIEGDQQTENDAERIRATGVPALQINTGRMCHLDAHGIGHAVQTLGIKKNSFLAIENVGNLVCPSSFDLGEAHKVVVLSVTEGEDKPLKYPDMFHAADLMILNKIDLLPYVDFDVERCEAFARRVNPKIQILKLSSTKGDNFSAWTDWLQAEIKTVR